MFVLWLIVIIVIVSWGAPCAYDDSSETGITCDCPYVSSPEAISQPLSVANFQCAESNPCTDSIHNSVTTTTAFVEDALTGESDSAFCFTEDVPMGPSPDMEMEMDDLP